MLPCIRQKEQNPIILPQKGQHSALFSVWKATAFPWSNREPCPEKGSILASLFFLTLRWVKQKTSKGLAKGIALSRTAFNKKSPVAEHARSALDIRSCHRAKNRSMQSPHGSK